MNERPTPQVEGIDFGTLRHGPATAPAAARGPFLEAIAAGPVILDAAMGTRLIERGLDLRTDDPALWVLSHPDEIETIHRRDVAAGSGAVLTNTFGASRAWLERFNRASATEAINRAAVALARRAAGPDRYVLGTIGPAAMLRDGAAAEQAVILVDAGVDALILETFRFGAAIAALHAVNDALGGEVPVCVSLWEWPDPAVPSTLQAPPSTLHASPSTLHAPPSTLHASPSTLHGESLWGWPDPAVAAAEMLEGAGAAVIGMNCQPGAAAALEFAERLLGRVRCPLLVKPAARQPHHDDDTPAALARACPRLVDRHVRLLGGCCGTTDRHIAALAAACASISPANRHPVAGETF